MGKCITKAIQANLLSFRHTQAYQELFRHIQEY